MAEMAETGGQQSYVWGPLTPLGLMIALLAGVADQVSKLWLLYGFDLESRVPVAIAPGSYNVVIQDMARQRAQNITGPLTGREFSTTPPGCS